MAFEPDSRLERIGNTCFESCGLVEMVIPRSVRSIEYLAFCNCQDFRSLRFEEGSQISSVGVRAFYGTQLTPENVRYPDTFRSDGREFEW